MALKQKKEELVRLIASHARSMEQESKRDSFDRFMSQLFIHPTYDDIRKAPPEKLAEGVFDLWQFLQQRTPGEPKVRVYYWRPTYPTAAAERVILDIVNDDMPFLVDSLNGMIEAHDLGVRITVHPILKVERDKNGQLLRVLDAEAENPAGHFESLIHCEVVDGAHPDLIPVLEGALKDVLRDVRYATGDWQGMRARAQEVIEELQDLVKQNPTLADDEVVQFIDWLRDDHFTFLGCGDFRFSHTEDLSPDQLPENTLGILRVHGQQTLSQIFSGITFNHEVRAYLMVQEALLVNKASLRARVHRTVPMDVIGVRRFDAKGNVVGLRLFVGLFTSVAYDSSTRDIPLFRKKIDDVLAHAGLARNWHDGKALIHILDSLPRDEFFQASTEELAEIGLEILHLQERHRVVLFVRKDRFHRFLSCLVYVPRERFDSALCEQMGDILAESLQGELSYYKAQFGSLPLARVHYAIALRAGLAKDLDFQAIEQKLVHAARSWADDLKNSLVEAYSDHDGQRLFRKYREAFGKGYQERFRGSAVIQDIHELEALGASGALHGTRLYALHGEDQGKLRLKLYSSGAPMPLSTILPTLENLGLKVISEIPFGVRPQGQEYPFWIQDFEAVPEGDVPFNPARSGNGFLEALDAVWRGELEDDGFNKLILRADLSARQASLMRTYWRYLWQLQVPYSRETVEGVLTRHPQFVMDLVQYFQQRFDPAIQADGSAQLLSIKQQLATIQSPVEDRILRRFANLFSATVRTNYFQKRVDGRPKPYISLKFKCDDIEDMPLPRPKFEIFVCSPRMEAVHLRGGKVARGGIRWSDRLDDFRTEILGLVKAQMVKNTVIVPVGSKGGFIVKHPPVDGDRDAQFAEGVECYRTMVRGLLDLTDNIVNGQMVPPQDVVRLDEDDPYLVVAADKGTATFSDYANAIAREYGFWLDDAFASGGSSGYDHKKMAITARGAWESVKRHFHEMGIDPQTSAITVAGVGDMSGDVFGNGMLYTDTLKVMACFNHQHIFIDPDPDLKKSHQERQRLFALPRSTWMDYDQSLISEGGGVFERSAKSIRVTPQMATLLEMPEGEATPTEVVRAILKMQVDLLWFGGIGTFIKSSRESNADVGDRANDAVRVNGRDVRAKVIGEGANLGCTQLGRIDYNRAGGRINTDAVDNAGGVNCSDHEVNIKILMNKAAELKLVNPDARDAVLVEMTDEVASLVLADNTKQALAISLMRQQGTRILDHQARMMRDMEAAGILNRSLEFLPDDTTLSEYQANLTALSRPELAVLMAYAKIWLYEQLQKSTVVDDFYFERELVSYFPKPLRGLRDAIKQHPLRRELVATYITNEIVNRMGATFIHEYRSKLGCSLEVLVGAYFTARDAFGLLNLWEEIDAHQQTLEPQAHLKALGIVRGMIRRTTHWAVLHAANHPSISDGLAALQVAVRTLLADLADCLNGEMTQRLNEFVQEYLAMGIAPTLANRIAFAQVVVSSPDTILLANESGYDVHEVAALYYSVGSRLGISRVLRKLDRLEGNNSWFYAATGGIREDLFNTHKHAVQQILLNARSQGLKMADDQALEVWLHQNSSSKRGLSDLLQDMDKVPTPDLALLTVICRELRCFVYGA
ncbi:MAG: NAD-glutamate dehydrogenase [Holosporales bacterium]